VPVSQILWLLHHHSYATVYSALLPCISDACLSIGSLKYMHHFGLDSFSNPREHWILQASLMHSISDEFFVLSFAFVLDASAFSSADLRRIGFVGGKIGSIGAASLIGFSRSKFRLSAHPARAKARSIANSHFIFAPRHAGSCTHSAQDALDAGGKKNGLKRRVADLLIFEWANKMSAWAIADTAPAIRSPALHRLRQEGEEVASSHCRLEVVRRMLPTQPLFRRRPIIIVDV